MGERLHPALPHSEPGDLGPAAIWGHQVRCVWGRHLYAKWVWIVPGWGLVFSWVCDISGVSVSCGEMPQKALWGRLWPCFNGFHKQETLPGNRPTYKGIDLNLQMMKLKQRGPLRGSQSHVCSFLVLCVCVCAHACVPLCDAEWLRCLLLLYCRDFENV